MKIILNLTVLMMIILTTSSCGDKTPPKIVKEPITPDVVVIGTQTWTAINLNVATFRNGDPIPEAKSPKEWKAASDNKQAAWCYYENNAANGTKFGKLYNWYAVVDARGLAKAGWHIPTDEEWTVLFDFLGGNDVAGKKMGTWKCKGTTPVIAESQKITLSGLLNEQGTEVTDQQMDSYVDDAVDDLDGYVAEYNLKSLYDILNALKGKTYQGQDAIKKFLDFYKQDEGVDFVTDVKSVGVANLSVMAKNMKPQIIALASGGGGTTPPVPTPGEKSGLKNIDIIWDGEKTDTGKNDSTKTKKKSGVNYHDCSGKETFEFGCISPKIAEIQGCLGITPQKGYFGPKTRKALTDMFGEKSVDGGITKDIYDKVMASCAEAKVDDRKKYSPEELKTIPIQKIQQTTGLKASDMKLPNITPLADTNKGERLYKIFQGNYETRNQEGNENDSYLFQEGNRMKYKGDALSQENLDVLCGYISGLGFDFMKAKPKEDYEFKYVWLKR
jgi:uncharacterized protein (TIGR02145 family)